MTAIKLSNSIDTAKLMRELNVTSGGISIMKDKAKTHLFYLKNLSVGAANILKQDALSIGADLAVPKGVVECSIKDVNALLICTTSQLKKLIKKEKAQPSGLKNLSLELESFLRDKTEIKIMGVVNVNEDSFYKNSRVEASSAMKNIAKMIEDGADIIDIGAVSSRPGSEGVSSKEELERVKDLIDEIYHTRIYTEATFSIDSYSPLVVEYALHRGFKIVNDITALSNAEVARLTASFKATAVLMHLRGTPKDMQQNPSYEDVIGEISSFFTQRCERAKSFGVEDIIIDVGIGFGKNLEHNLTLLNHLEHFSKFGYELLVGASRKSMIDMITPTKIEDRLPGTLAIHLESIKRGASIIRCHDVKEHIQAIKVYEAINDTLI